MKKYTHMSHGWKNMSTQIACNVPKTANNRIPKKKNKTNNQKRRKTVIGRIYIYYLLCIGAVSTHVRPDNQ